MGAHKNWIKCRHSVKASGLPNSAFMQDMPQQAAPSGRTDVLGQRFTASPSIRQEAAQGGIGTSENTNMEIL